MPVTNGYVTLPELKTWTGISDNVDDTNLEQCINAASRWIDTYCGQRFYVDSAATARTYAAHSTHIVDIDPLGSTTDLVIKVDSNGDGTFETTLSASDYLLLPDDAPDVSEPWTQVQAVGSYTFPQANLYPYTRQERVQVTGRWGAPAVPEDVKLACLMHAHRLFTRRKSPEGVAGFNDFGLVRTARDIDPQVVALLASHRLVTIGAA